MKFPKLFRGASPQIETKESAAAASMVLTPGQPVWSKRNFAAFSHEGYQKNVIASMCVQKIAEAVSSVKLEVWRGETELTDHPLLELFDRPNPLQSGREYVEAYISYLMIAGNSYEERIDIGGNPRELYVLRPDRMSPIIGADGLPSGYEYRGPNGKRVRWDIDVLGGVYPIWHTRLFNPLDDWLGQSPMEAGAYSIDQHNEAMGWMQALLQNSARPSGALSSSEQLSDDQFHRLKEQVESQYSGAANAGRPMLLEGGLSWQAMGLSPTDMGIVDAKNSAARDVALAFGVPPQLLGIPGDNTYCLPYDARVSTPDGPKKIGDIRPGDVVYSQDGDSLTKREVTWHGNVGRKQTYRVKLTDRDIVATGNHPILIRRDNGDGKCHLLYVPVENLQPGDIAVIAHALPHVSLEKDPMGRDLDPHKMELYGFYTGDGSSALPVSQEDGKGYRRGGFVSLAIPDGASYLDHYATVLAKEAGGACVISAPRCITVASSELSRRLCDLGLTGTAHTKRVPAWVFQTSKEMKLAYLRGILDSDGSVDKNGRMSLSLCNLDLVTDIWHLAMGCGLRVGRIWSREANVTLPQGTPFLSLMHGFMISEPESVLEIGTRTPEYFDRICKNCGKSKFKRHWYSTGGAAHSVAIREVIDTEYMSYSRVLDILPEGEVDVYDIEVDGTHNFIADGVFVHNSNYAEARLAFWEDTVLPLLGRMIDERNAWLATPMGVEVRANVDDIPAIVDKRQSLWQMADASTDLTINERRAMKGYEPIPGGDVLPQDRMFTADPFTQETNVKALGKLAGYEISSRK